MSLEILQSIEQMEAKAEDIRIKAGAQARDMIKAVETAVSVRERDEAVTLRALYQSLLDDRRKQVEKKLESVHEKKDQERAAMISKAESFLDKAANVIFERVVNNGNR